MRRVAVILGREERAAARGRVRDVLHRSFFSRFA